MSRASELQARIANIAQLLDVVTAMRSLAGARIQRAERALPSVRHYADIMDDAIARVWGLVGAAPPDPDTDQRPRVIVACSEHGFAGAFNERLIEVAAREAPETELWMVGRRGLPLAHARGLEVEWSMPMATHVAGVYEAARQLALEVERRLVRDELGRVSVLWTHREGGGDLGIARVDLLPLRPPAPASYAPGGDTPSRNTAFPPLHHVPAPVLLGRVIDELVVAELTRVLMESFASENTARLHAMETAHRNIETELDKLRSLANRARQEDITAELLDVITGAEAVRAAGD